jgi:hypothetical protein
MRPNHPPERSDVHVAGGFGSGQAGALALAICRVWDLLWVSDSAGSGGVPEAYARRIEADLGVAVRVHDAWESSLRGEDRAHDTSRSERRGPVLGGV